MYRIAISTVFFLFVYFTISGIHGNTYKKTVGNVQLTYSISISIV